MKLWFYNFTFVAHLAGESRREFNDRKFKKEFIERILEEGLKKITIDMF